MIATGHANMVIAGGAEMILDVPIQFSRPICQKLICLPKAIKKGPLSGVTHMLKDLKLKDLVLETLAIANYTTVEVMGASSDHLSAKFGVSRQEQDKFVVHSHQLVHKAHVDGFYKGEVVAYKGSKEENGIKADSTYKSVVKLATAFMKLHGMHIAANSSFLTDGASTSLIMSEDRRLSWNTNLWWLISMIGLSIPVTPLKNSCW